MNFQYGDVLEHELSSPVGANRMMFIVLTYDCPDHFADPPCVQGIDLSGNHSGRFIECYVEQGWTKVEDQ